MSTEIQEPYIPLSERRPLREDWIDKGGIKRPPPSEIHRPGPPPAQPTPPQPPRPPIQQPATQPAEEN